MRSCEKQWFFRKSPKEVKKSEIFEYIRVERTKVKLMCKILEVSESGYYKWLKKSSDPSKHEILLGEIVEIHEENEDYGGYRICLELKLFRGYTGCYQTIRSICKKHGIKAKTRKRHPNGITKADEKSEASKNLIHQDFTSDEPNKKWLGDITEVACSDGKLYICGVLDCYDGDIVGLTMDDNMRKELCIDALSSAYRRYCKNGSPGLIFHSDRGSQYTSYKYREKLTEFGITQSMSSSGRCYDNARMESFWATLKKELIYKHSTEHLKMAEVKSMVFRYVHAYYNRRRIYTPNDGLPPLIMRQLFYHSIASAA